MGQAAEQGGEFLIADGRKTLVKIKVQQWSWQMALAMSRHKLPRCPCARNSFARMFKELDEAGRGSHDGSFFRCI